MLVYANHHISPSQCSSMLTIASFRHIIPVLILVYTDRHISPFEGGWGDVLFKRCNILKAFTDRHILPSQCSSMLTIASFRHIIPVLILVYTDHRISPFEGGWGDVFDVLFKRCNILKAFTNHRISPS